MSTGEEPYSSGTAQPISTVTEEHSYIYASGMLLRETITSGNTTRTLDFRYDNVGYPYALIYNNGSTTATYYYITNLQGDVMYLVDGNGIQVAAYTYDPYGKILSATGAMAEINPLRYRGYYYDAETGFYYLQSRYYDPNTCRFINADSYASTDQGLIGYNMFVYCGNNPVCYTDTSGHSFIGALLFLTVPVATTISLTACSAKNSVGAALEYQSVAGGTPDSTANCYSYAIGIYDKSYNPGDFSRPMQGYSVEDVAVAVMQDLTALGRSCRFIDGANAEISDDEYRIALRVKQQPMALQTPSGVIIDWDYHFMVQTSSGAWAEKHGPGGDSILHAAGETPDTISWDCGTQIGYYDSKIIYFAISP